MLTGAVAAVALVTRELLVMVAAGAIWLIALGIYVRWTTSESRRRRS